MLLNCSAGEDSWEPLGQQGDQTSQFYKEISPEYSLEALMLKLKLQYTLAIWCKALTHWTYLDAGKDWRQEDLGMTEDEMLRWHHWSMDIVWVSSGSWWWTGKPGMLQSVGSQRVGQDWEIELNLYTYICVFM